MTDEIALIAAKGMASADHRGDNDDKLPDVWHMLSDVQQRSYLLDANNALAALTAKGLVVVPIEPSENQKNHVIDLVSQFVSDDDHLRFVTAELVIRCYRAMCRVMIAVKE